MRLEDKQSLLQCSLAFLGALQFGPLFGETAIANFMPVTASLTGALLVLYVGTRHKARKFIAFKKSYRAFMDRGMTTLDEHAILALMEEDGTLTHANANFAAALGIPDDQLLGRSAYDLFAEGEGTSPRAVREVTDFYGSWQGEVCLRRADGGLLWLHMTLSGGTGEKGTQAGQTIIIASDITSYKKAIADRRVFEALDQMQDCVFLLSDDGQTVKYVNKMGRARRRWSQEDVKTKTIKDFGFGTDGALMQTQFDKLMESPDDVVNFEAEVGSSSFEARLQRLESDGDEQSILMVIRDVTSEKEIIRMRRDFISNVSHELRTPLTSIKGAMGLVLSGAAGEVSTNAKSMIDIAHRNADRLVSIINDLLDIEKITAGQMPIELAPTNLSDLVVESIQATQSYAEMFDITFDYKNEGKTFVAEVDSARTIQVLTNLLSNAAKFSNKGDHVDVSIDRTPEGFALKVRDHGKGVPPEDAARIFERFSQSQKAENTAVRGTGLGLAIVKAIVEQQGGTVTFESVVGEGSTVTVTFMDIPNEAGGAGTAALKKVA